MMVLMGMAEKRKYTAETGRLDNSNQVAAIGRRLVAAFVVVVVVYDRKSAAPTVLGIFSDCIPSAYALG